VKPLMHLRHSRPAQHANNCGNNERILVALAVHIGLHMPLQLMYVRPQM
jgi:hypothetical protein